MDLLTEDPPVHAPEHDLESLFYCLLWVVSKRRWGGNIFRPRLLHPLLHWGSVGHNDLRLLRKSKGKEILCGQYKDFVFFGREINIIDLRTNKTDSAKQAKDNITATPFADDPEIQSELPVAQDVGFKFYLAQFTKWQPKVQGIKDAALNEALIRIFAKINKLGNASKVL